MVNDLRHTVLVVDDVPENIDALSGILADQYKVKAATSGERALKIAASTKNPPALILLDVMMPGMDGYEVCRRLKEDPETTEIPVIFVTAKDGQDDVVHGFDLGAVDYIAKPIEPREVLSRVRAHVALRQAHVELENSYHELQQAQGARDALFHMIVHDMRTPLTGIRGSLDVVAMIGGKSLDDRVLKLINNANSSAGKLVEMVSSMLDLNKMEAGEFPLEVEEGLVQPIIREAVEAVGDPLNEFTLVLPELSDLVHACDRNVVRRILVNLLGNAIKFTPAGSRIEVSVDPGDTELTVTVADTGPGIPPEYHDKIFEKFGQARLKQEQKNYSTGIGLAFCKLAAEAHGGRIWVESKRGEGSRFRFTLPNG